MKATPDRNSNRTAARSPIITTPIKNTPAKQRLTPTNSQIICVQVEQRNSNKNTTRLPIITT